VACTTLAGVWASGQAPCRPDCSGYDVTGCASGQATEVVYPALRDARWASARCNDQSPFAFEVWLSPTRSNVWVVSFEGGGSCDGTYTSCAGRAAGLVSSKMLPADRSPAWTPGDGTLLSRDAGVNPRFFEANLVFAHYCSSDGWSGTNDVPQPIALKGGKTGQWVFTGRLNARAIAEVLFRGYGLDDATSELFITGNSAGGFGAFTDADLFAARLPRTIARRRLAVAPNASWLIPFADPNFPYHGYTTITEDQVAADTIATYHFDANPRCLALAAAAGRGASACRSGLLAWRGLTRPPPTGWGLRVLVAKNRLDQGQLSDYLIPTADTTDPKALAARAAWYALETSTMAELDWLYAPADPMASADDPNLHGILNDGVLWPWEPPGFAGLSAQALVTRFWNDEAPVRVEYEGETPHADRAQ
jgi:hypothetical protein